MVGLATRFVGVVDAGTVMRTDDARRGGMLEQALEEAMHVNDMRVAVVARKGAQLGKSLREDEKVTLLECEDCNKEIPAKRRRAAPNATRCVDCQSKYES